jgi:hypothetical protein
MFVVRPGDYPLVEHQSVLHSGRLCLSHKHLIRLAMLAKDKHSGLLQAFVNYGQKKFYNIGPGFKH